MKNKSKYLKLLTIVGLSLLLGAGTGFYYYNSSSSETLASVEEAAEETVRVPVEVAYPYVFKRNTTFFSSLRDLDIPGSTIHSMVEATKPVHNLSLVRPGDRYQVFYDANNEIEGLHIRLSPINTVKISRVGVTWQAEKTEEPVDIQVVTYSGIVKSSLWESAVNAKMDPNLIAELAEIFAWEVDFSREVQVDDRWRLTVEQKLVQGEPIGWGSILAAEYENTGTVHRAALFRHEGKNLGYFAPDGTSLRKMFLKSPLKFGRISSRFNRARFHPILKTRRPHLGVDYAAPIGTPIRAVGDGRVTFARWSGGGGKVLKIRHNGTYQTAYKHLNGFARGIRPGTRVKQGQIIGYVGNTGMSTGPHLHFEFYQNGTFVDPLGKKFPSADPVPREHLEQFKAESEILLAALPIWETDKITQLEPQEMGNNN